MTFAWRGYSISRQHGALDARTRRNKGKNIHTTRYTVYARIEMIFFSVLTVHFFLLLSAETFAQELDLERKARQQQSAQQNQQQSQHSDRDIKSPVPGTV